MAKIYEVPGSYRTYVVIDKKGDQYTVRWTAEGGLALKVPRCTCSEAVEPYSVCSHARAAYEHSVGADHAAKFPIIKKPCTFDFRKRQAPPAAHIPENEMPAIREKVAAALLSGTPVVTGVWPVYTVTTGQEVQAVVHDELNRARCSCNPNHLGWWMSSCLHVAIANEYNTALTVASKGTATPELLECARTGIVGPEILEYHLERRQHPRRD